MAGWSLPCRLDGRTCPGPECPFWVAGDCLLAGVDLGDSPETLAWLVGVRTELEERAPADPER